MRRIAELRKKHKLSQFKLAEKLGLSQQTISKYERGKIEPDIGTLKSLANIFNVSVGYLVESTNLPNKDDENIPAPLYMQIAQEAQNHHLAEKDVLYVLDLCRRLGGTSATSR
ncbi:MAG: helix-turn-helix domain-containing protein [Peptococcaceae bacterium]|nr:helix-turn-helix domain-containing protein [Peptococcaceae bacterium]